MPPATPPRSSSCRGALAAALSLAGPFLAQGGAGEIRGAVHDPLFEPVADARVSLRTEHGAQVLGECRTDASGHFFFAGVPNQTVYVHVESPGLHRAVEWVQPLSAAAAAAPRFVDVRLYAAAAVRGVVRDADGAPVAGAQVTAMSDRLAMNLLENRRGDALTDAAGQFEVAGVPLGEVAVRASAAGFELGETALYLERDADVELELARGDGRTLTVTVAGVPPERMPDIACRFFVSPPFPEPGMYLPRRLVEAGFDASGSCVVRGLPQRGQLAMIRLEAVGMRFVPQWREVAAGADGDVSFRLESITGPRPGRGSPPPPDRDSGPDPAPAADAPLVPTKFAAPTLQGVLRDASGAPHALTRLRLYCDRTGWRESVTAADGSFVFDAAFVPGDKLAFQIRHRGLVLQGGEPGRFASVWAEYERGRSYELVAAPGARVSGIVRDPRRKPVPGVQVRMESVLAELGGLTRFLAVATTDAAGRFAIDGLAAPPGPCRLSVTGLRGTAEADGLRPGRDNELADVVLQLEPPREITGVVVGADRKPVAGARVQLAEPGQRMTFPTFGDDFALTDAKGRFAIRGMRPGDYVVQVRVVGDDVAGTSETVSVQRRKSARCRIKVDRK